MQTETEPLEGETVDARLNRYRVFDEVNAPYIAWQLDQFRPFLGARILEVGCGVGSVLAQLGDRELLMGVDVEQDILDFARSRFNGHARYEFAHLDVAALNESQLADLKQHRFDTVVCINVLEHVPDDERAMNAMADILVPGGTLNLLVPAHPMLYGPYDKMEGHFRRYTRKRLRELVSKAGLEAIRLYHFNAVGAAGWWVQYRLLRRQIHQQTHFQTIQRMLPALKAVESRLRPPFGLSLVAIARKPNR